MTNHEISAMQYFKLKLSERQSFEHDHKLTYKSKQESDL